MKNSAHFSERKGWDEHKKWAGADSKKRANAGLSDIHHGWWIRPIMVAKEQFIRSLKRNHNKCEHWYALTQKISVSLSLSLFLSLCLSLSLFLSLSVSLSVSLSLSLSLSLTQSTTLICLSYRWCGTSLIQVHWFNSKPELGTLVIFCLAYINVILYMEYLVCSKVAVTFQTGNLF